MEWAFYAATIGTAVAGFAELIARNTGWGRKNAKTLKHLRNLGIAAAAVGAGGYASKAMAPAGAIQDVGIGGSVTGAKPGIGGSGFTGVGSGLENAGNYTGTVGTGVGANSMNLATTAPLGIAQQPGLIAGSMGVEPGGLQQWLSTEKALDRTAMASSANKQLWAQGLIGLGTGLVSVAGNKASGKAMDRQAALAEAELAYRKEQDARKLRNLNDPNRFKRNPLIYSAIGD